MINLSKKLIGNENLFNKILDVFFQKNLSNSIMFYGPKGIGKATFVFSFITKAIESLSTNPNKENISNLIYNNSHPNVRYIQREYDNAKANFNKFITIDQIRNLDNFLNQTSLNNLPNFIIIDSADDLNTNSSNSLLKSLEEPKNNNFFLIIANQISNISATIRSRCIKFHLDIPTIENFKSIIKLSDEKLEHNVEYLFQISNGSPGIALKLNSQKINFLHHNIIEILSNKEMNINYKINELSESVVKFTNEEYRIFLTILKFILMNLIKINLGISNQLLEFLNYSSVNINNSVLLKILEYLNNNEDDLFTYNLDKKIFCFNIFHPLNKN